MAENKRSSRRPVSLNDSHYRFLQDLSAPPKPSAKPNSSEKEQQSTVVTLKSCSKGDDHAFDNNVLQFSGITQFDSPRDEKKSVISEALLSRDQGCAMSKPLDEQEKPVKVRVKGRRRLYKVSSQDAPHAENGVFKDEPELSDVADYESPPPTQTVNKSDNYKSGNEIRDILNDLSSRLEILSIGKKNALKTIGPVDGLGMNEDAGQQSKVNMPEYASVGSTFSFISDLNDSPLDETKISVGGTVESLGVNYQELKGDNLDDESHETKNTNISSKMNVREDENLVSARNSFESNNEEEVTSVWKEYEDDCQSRVDETENIIQVDRKNESRKVCERLRYAGRSFVSCSRQQDDDDDNDDCLVVSGNEWVEKKKTSVSKYREGANNLLDDYTDDFCSVDDGSITLSGPRNTYKLPGNIAKMLFPHQREGLRWLWSLHCQGKGGILGDDMGLGKTMQICGFLAGLFHSRLIKRALIVAPKTLLSHWIKELSVVGLSRKTREYYGTCSKARQYELQYVLQDKGILLTTYDIVRNNSKSLRGDTYLGDDDITWDYMILDEGHLIKNPSTQRAKSLLEVPSAHRIIISGTPIQNNLKELWALFNFCCPELLGDKKWFKERFENPILHGNDKHASDREKRIGSTTAKELRERIQPYFLRRLKNEVFREDDATSTGKLSKKNEIIVWLRMTSCQRRLYEAFLNSEIVISAFDGSPLAALTILKKICDHPLLLTKRAAEDVLDGMDSMLNPEDASMAAKLAMHIADVADEDDFREQHDNISCKISFISSLLDQLIPAGHKVLIFSQTRKMLNLIQESIVSNGYTFLRIDGTSKASDRMKIVDDFQERDVAPIFLLTSQVGGLGLTLTKADRVIVVDPAWNPSTDNQSVDRAYRIGQKKDVIVYRLMTCGTVEEKIYRKQIYKGGLFRTATEHKEQIRYFSQQDLRELFSLPKQGFDISLTQQQLHEEHDSQHNMDESFEAHITFLQTLGIAGVSHHSLLFSKTAPVQTVQEDEEEIRNRRPTNVGYSSSNRSVEQNVNGIDHAFKPKDIKLNRKVSSPDSSSKLTESEIKERIGRLSQLLSNKVTIERLPDKGAKLRSHIEELNTELDKMRREARSEQKAVIDLDEISGSFKRVLNV